MRFRHILPLGLLGLLLTVAACGKQPLPAAGSLSSEDFGLGVSLGMDLDSARSASGAASGSVKVEFVTPESILNREPYKERPPGQDLALYVFSEEQPEAGVADAVPANTVFEIKLYLAPPEQSKLTLLGEPAAALNPDEMVALLGEPFTPMAASPDGRWHLCFYFALEDKPRRALRLTSSHEVDGHCFAIELAEVEAPK